MSGLVQGMSVSASVFTLVAIAVERLEGSWLGYPGLTGTQHEDLLLFPLPGLQKARTALWSVVLNHRGKGGVAACPLELGDCRGYCHLLLEDLEAAPEEL